jgi:hypothetical protein
LLGFLRMLRGVACGMGASWLCNKVWLGLLRIANKLTHALMNAQSRVFSTAATGDARRIVVLQHFVQMASANAATLVQQVQSGYVVVERYVSEHLNNEFCEE